MFSCPNFKFTVKQWDFGIIVFILKFIVGPMNIAQQLSNVMNTMFMCLKHYIKHFRTIKSPKIWKMKVLCIWEQIWTTHEYIVILWKLGNIKVGTHEISRNFASRNTFLNLFSILSMIGLVYEKIFFWNTFFQKLVVCSHGNAYVRTWECIYINIGTHIWERGNNIRYIWGG